MSSFRTRSPMVIYNNQLYVNTYRNCRTPYLHRKTGEGGKGFIFIIMSFGQHEYQHRFHKDVKGRAKLRLPSAPQYPYGEYNDYLYNSLLIDSFKRDADYNRNHRRLRSIAPSYYHPYPYSYTRPYPYYDGVSVSRVVTEPPLVESPPRVVYVNKEAPDVLPSLINYTAMASRVREAEQEAKRAQAEAAQEREQLREYRHKYERLKSRLREEVGERRVRQAELRQRREAELQSEKQKIERMGQAVMQMSHQVSNNSRMMEESMKLREVDLTHDKVVVFPSVPTVLSRSRLIDRPMLDSQYRQMRRLKKQIGELDRKLGYSSNQF